MGKNLISRSIYQVVWYFTQDQPHLILMQIMRNVHLRMESICSLNISMVSVMKTDMVLIVVWKLFKKGNCSLWVRCMNWVMQDTIIKCLSTENHKDRVKYDIFLWVWKGALLGFEHYIWEFWETTINLLMWMHRTKIYMCEFQIIWINKWHRYSHYFTDTAWNAIFIFVP